MSDLRRKRTTAAFFLAPFFVLFTGVMIIPIGYAAYLSLFREQSSGLGFGGTERSFVGLGNFTRALSDEAFRSGFLHLIGYCLLYIPIMIGGALLLALVLDGSLAKGKRFFQLAIFMPHAVPSVIAAIVWLFLYTPGLSPILQALESGGLSWNFFGASQVTSSIVNMAVWQWIGYNMIIFFAALQAIPKELIEAATVDGAGGLRTALRIKVPMIRSAIVLTVLFTVIGSIQLFTEPQTLYSKAPAMGSDWSPIMYIFKATSERHDYGLASAASLMLAVLAGTLSFVVTRLGNRWKSA